MASPPWQRWQERIRWLGGRTPDSRGRFVLYWMQTSRRLQSNYALEVAAGWAAQLGKPLVVYEGLKRNYPWANARHHAFALQGMRDNAAAARQLGLTYWPFVETPQYNGHGLLRQLAATACLIVTDDYPAYIVPAHLQALAGTLTVPLLAVDGNSLIPLRQLGPTPVSAGQLRHRWHRLFPQAWQQRASVQPHLPAVVRRAVEPPFPLWDVDQDLEQALDRIGVDRTVAPVPGTPGGTVAAHKRLRHFLTQGLPRYAEQRNHPDDPQHGAASGLSPYLRWGHLGVQEVVEAVLGPDWTVGQLDPSACGRREGFFSRDANVNAFLDELLIWRDVGYVWHYFFRQQVLEGLGVPGGTVSWHTGTQPPHFHFARWDFSVQRDDPLALVLPRWAYETLQRHAADRRAYCYSLEQWEAADTHDPLWNAAQQELRHAGRIHNYLRMLWGKKVLEWSATPLQAYLTLEHLNNKYALDGRDPNSYTGILWCFGLFDRPWGPERPVFGTVRYMSSENTARKFPLQGYYDYVARLSQQARPRSVTTQSGNLFG
ncbi:MAG: deoxyribodipyrimidine photolyase [Gemmataceae bacterium]|nr:deoxyribodipyrimidine photolyase [Gemmataceae bacterium]MDW8244425.1 deoxyribodipyrimidine photolyase [Thermogemmata sp.]